MKPVFSKLRWVEILKILAIVIFVPPLFFEIHPNLVFAQINYLHLPLIAYNSCGSEFAFKAIAVGGFHTCGLTDEGGVKCWGSNFTGQLGNGTKTSSWEPVDVINLGQGIIQIAAGPSHTCAVTNQGGVKCWGYNSYGELGDGMTAMRVSPVDVLGLTNGVNSIALGGKGDGHTCALTKTGGVKCWGSNQFGQIGDGTNVSRSTPVDVFGLSIGVAAISLGRDHSCALTEAGSVKCWGRNLGGCIGDGTTSNRNIPVDVLGVLNNVTSITMGAAFTCALTNEGSVKCWGTNYRGQLGDGTTTERLTPVNVIGLSTNIKKIDAGTNHVCAITDTGTLKCWGRNEDGELGDGTTINRLFPVDVHGIFNGVISVSAGGSYDLMPYAHTCSIVNGGKVKCWGYNGSGQLGVHWNSNASLPVDVKGLGEAAISVEAGWDFTCALTGGGGVECWGSNRHGKLGDGTTNSRTYPDWVSGMSGGISSITLGDALWDDSFSCAVTTGGGLKCWGSNEFGQLGDGTRLDRFSPVSVSGLTSGVRMASAGGEHACAVTSTGGAKCWGRNASGRLGDGTTTERLTPTNVSGLTSGVSKISGGYDFTCALTSSGVEKCWGDNYYGQLGDGTKTDRSTPVNVLGLTSGVNSISAGIYYACAKTTSGGVKCWGSNQYGKLGNGTNIDSTTPVDVYGLGSGVVDIATGPWHSCALTVTGGVKCWGNNDYGQLGDGTTTERWTPVDVLGLASGVVAISAGEYHTCAATSQGNVKCWGAYHQGQLGDGSVAYRTLPQDLSACRY